MSQGLGCVVFSHQLEVVADGKYLKCLRNPKIPTTNCALCNSKLLHLTNVCTSRHGSAYYLSLLAL